MSRLVHYFPDADMRGGYDKLRAVALRDRDFDIENLQNGHFVCFVNRKRDKLKLCTHSDMVAYLRLNNRKIDPQVIQHLPEFFDGSTIQYDRAMEKVMQNNFPKWFENKVTK